MSALVVVMAVDVSRGVDVGEIAAEVTEAMFSKHETAWRQAGMDGGTWSRALRGQAPLDLWKLRDIQIEWWLQFGTKLMAALIRHWFVSGCDEQRRMAKASLRREPWNEQEKRQA